MSSFALSSICPKCSSHFQIKDGQAVAKVDGSAYPFPITRKELSGLAQKIPNASTTTKELPAFPSPQKVIAPPITHNAAISEPVEIDDLEAFEEEARKKNNPLPPQDLTTQAVASPETPAEEFIETSLKGNEPASAEPSASVETNSEAEPHAAPEDEAFEKIPLYTKSIYPAGARLQKPTDTATVIEDTTEDADLEKVSLESATPMSATAQNAQDEDPLPPPPLKENEIGVQCFECRTVHNIHKSSTSSLCPKCGFYISLKNFDIKGKSAQQIKTRGDVRIYKKGVVNNISIQSHNLTVEGTFSGSASCTGDLIIRQHAKIMGPVECQNLIIESKAQVTFADQVHARKVSIDGEVSGNISCTGHLSLQKKAQLKGDIHVRTLSMEEGAAHNGRITMISDEEAVSNILASVRKSFAKGLEEEEGSTEAE